MNEQVMNGEDTELLDEYDFSQAKSGPIVASPPHKTRITIRVDTDVLDWFRDSVNVRGGGSYQAMINQALREYIEHQQEDLESTLRRVLREELQLIQNQSKLMPAIPITETHGFLAGIDTTVEREPDRV
jgi:uncharacterized protein (DUF4415 family)